MPRANASSSSPSSDTVAALGFALPFVFGIGGGAISSDSAARYFLSISERRQTSAAPPYGAGQLQGYGTLPGLGASVNFRFCPVEAGRTGSLNILSTSMTNSDDKRSCLKDSAFSPVLVGSCFERNEAGNGKWDLILTSFLESSCRNYCLIPPLHCPSTLASHHGLMTGIDHVPSSLTPPAEGKWNCSSSIA